MAAIDATTGSTLMNIHLLIDAIVRQTVILIAQLATTAGARAPLAHVANEVFLSLVNELKSQGLGHKVIADMFGLALRTYHSRIQRLSESATERGRSLWEAILTYIVERDVVLRAELLERFHRDDEQTVRSVLSDLVDSSLIFKTGRADRTAYRAASQDELRQVIADDPAEGIAAMVQVGIHRIQPTTRDAVLKLVPMADDDLDNALATLLAAGRIRSTEAGGQALYTCEQCVIPYGTSVGWEAAVFDHYQALVTALVTRLNAGATRALPRDAVGGSTWGIDLYEGHPLEEETLALLSGVRQLVSDLRTRVDAHNASVDLTDKTTRRVIFYAGQSVLVDAAQPEGGAA